MSSGFAAAILCLGAEGIVPGVGHLNQAPILHSENRLTRLQAAHRRQAGWL